MSLSVTSLSRAWEFTKETFYNSRFGMSSLEHIFPGHFVPRDIVRLIFRSLPPEDLLRICCVCKLWDRLASDNRLLWNTYHLRELFPTSGFVDQLQWLYFVNWDELVLQKLGLDIEEKARPVLDKHTYLALKRLITPCAAPAIPPNPSFLSRFFAIPKIRPQIEDDAGISFVTIPKGLTFNKLISLGNENRRHVFGANSHWYLHCKSLDIDDRVLKGLGDQGDCMINYLTPNSLNR